MIFYFILFYKKNDILFYFILFYKKNDILFYFILIYFIKKMIFFFIRWLGGRENILKLNLATFG